MNSVTKSLLFLAAFASSVTATTTFNVAIGEARTSGGAMVATGTVGILVVDNAGNGFAGSTAGTFSALSGLVLSVGQVFGGDDRILGVILASDLSGSGDIGFVDAVNVNYTTHGVDANDKIAIYWFPGITSSGATVPSNQAQVGYFRTDTLDGPSGANGTFVLPSDTGAAIDLYYTTPALGGATASSSLTSFAVSAAPEPSRASFMAMALLGLLMRRKR